MGAWPSQNREKRKKSTLLPVQRRPYRQRASQRWRYCDGRKANGGRRLFASFGVRVHGGFADQEVFRLAAEAKKFFVL